MSETVAERLRHGVRPHKISIARGPTSLDDDAIVVALLSIVHADFVQSGSLRLL
jgi:hypothetical protein